MSIALFVGLVLGLLLTLLQRHPRRILGFLFLSTLATTICLLVALVLPTTNIWLDAPIGLFFGFLPMPTATLLQPKPTQGKALFRYPVLGFIVVFILAAGFCMLSYYRIAAFLISALAMMFAAVLFWRFSVELLMELVLWPMYHMRGIGPGLKTIPRRGPLIIVANHSCWMDPFFLGKVIPRRLIPLMGSGYYDLPVMRWLMKNVVGAIRLQQYKFRRQFPELKDAVSALDEGQCLVLFPEGHLRRSDDKPLARFGQGIWQILKQRPRTPVVTCWIEGGWGSFFSYQGGKPTKNKRVDIRRSIRISVDMPEVLPESMLGDQKETRNYLMERCLNARSHLGLASRSLPTPAQRTED